eukprot:6306194-Pyramimonas_sp.AAC.1
MCRSRLMRAPRATGPFPMHAALRETAACPNQLHARELAHANYMRMTVRTGANQLIQLYGL